MVTAIRDQSTDYQELRFESGCKGGGGAKESEDDVVSSPAQKANAPIIDTWTNSRLTPRSFLLMGGHGGVAGVLEELAQNVKDLGGTVLKTLCIDSTPTKLVYLMDLVDQSEKSLLLRCVPKNYNQSTFNNFFKTFIKNKPLDFFNSYDVFEKEKTLPYSATTCESYNMIPELKVMEQELRSIFSSPLVGSAKRITVSGGNMLKLQGPRGKVLVIGRQSFENEFILSHMNTKHPNINSVMKSLPEYIQKMTEGLRSKYELTETDQLLIVPNNSYHLDLDVCSPKPGLVVLATYRKFIDAADKTLKSFLSIVNTKTKELGFVVNQNVRPLEDLPTVKKILKIKEGKLNEIQIQLEASGITVVRAFGNLPLTMNINNGSVYKTDGYELFNFFNGISMTDPNGSFHYFCLATYEEFENHSSEFSQILKEMGVICHFLGKNTPRQNHYELQKHQSGLHCVTAVLSLEMEAILKKKGTEAFNSKNWTLAKKLYLQAHEINPGDYTCLSNAALMAKKEKSFKESIDLSKQVLKAHDLGKSLKEGLVQKNTKWIQDCTKELEKACSNK